MVAFRDQARSATPDAEASAGAGQPEATPRSPAADQRIYLYEAVSTRRDQVLDAFAGQRAAILKAVADQRAAALAPVLAVQAKRANAPAAAPARALPAGLSDWAQLPVGKVTIGREVRRRPLGRLGRAVAADIVSLIKILVAAEVRAQLAAMQSPAAVQYSSACERYTEIQPSR